VAPVVPSVDRTPQISDEAWSGDAEEHDVRQ
jgi:hypothetical protein